MDSEEIIFFKFQFFEIPNSKEKIIFFQIIQMNLKFELLRFPALLLEFGILIFVFLIHFWNLT